MSNDRRIISTIKELNTLPNGTVILGEDGRAYQAVKREDGTNAWLKTGISGTYHAMYSEDFTVLYTPRPAR